MSNIHYISTDVLSLEAIQEIIYQHKTLELSEEARVNIQKCRDYLDAKMEANETPIYGINTGFGSLCNVKISNENLSKLQENLVKSHACGTGEEVPSEIVKLMLLLKIQSLSYGYSGVQLVTVLRLIDFYNNDILPVIYTQGSLGASGDLAPLAHLALPLIGEGKSIIPDPRIKNGRWSGIALQWMAYGYGVSFTPLQTLTFYNAIANDGVMVRPKFLREIKEIESSVETFDTEIINPRICSKENRR